MPRDTISPKVQRIQAGEQRHRAGVSVPEHSGHSLNYRRNQIYILSTFRTSKPFPAYVFSILSLHSGQGPQDACDQDGVGPLELVELVIVGESSQVFQSEACPRKIFLLKNTVSLEARFFLDKGEEFCLEFFERFHAPESSTNSVVLDLVPISLL